MEHRTTAQLEAGLEEIRRSPKDHGVLKLIVTRPAVGQREVNDTGELSVAEGLHVYVFAPLAFSVALSPLQMETLGVTEITGMGLTVTVTCVVPTHPFKSPVTVYVVVERGVAVTIEPVALLNVAAGPHV